MATTDSPTLSCAERPSATGRSTPTPIARTTAMSALGSVPITWARTWRPLENCSSTSEAPSTTWLLVSTWPRASSTKPEPVPWPLRPLTWMETTLGSTVAAELVALVLPPAV